MARVLIVGGDGLIGRHLSKPLEDAGFSASATSRHRNAQRFLDLSTPSASDPTRGFDAVVLTAAVTSRAACENDPDAARSVNVEAAERLARPLLARGGHLVFLSTHIVLGGAQPFLPPEAPYAPCDVYSAQKAEAEQRLTALPGASDNLTILRLTKVLTGDTGLIRAWKTAIAARRPIGVYSDLVMAPVTPDHVATEIAGCLRSRATGPRHVSGAEEISYADFAERLAARLNWPPGLLRAQAGRPVNPIAAATPPHASLQAAHPQSLESVIDTLR